MLPACRKPLGAMSSARTASSAAISAASTRVNTMPSNPGSLPTPRSLSASIVTMDTSTLRYPIEKIHDPAFQRILRADHQQAVVSNELLDDFRTMPQVIYRCAD